MLYEPAITLILHYGDGLVRIIIVDVQVACLHSLEQKEI